VFATPTSSGLAQVCARALLTALSALAMAFAILSAPVRAESECEGMGFWTCNAPSFHDLVLPSFRDLKFWQEDSKKGRNAYRDGDYARAYKYFRRASEEGDIVADWYLGHMYRLGRGVERSDAKAFSYYGRVADSYNADEQSQKKLRIMVDGLVRVADYYRLGGAEAGIPQDFARAIRIYKLASTHGHPAAEYGLGIMRLRGQGMKAKPEQGLTWLSKAARKRYAPAQAYLGNLYWKGDNVVEDRTRALMWYILAQETARPDENPEIIDRLDVLLASSSEEERIEAEARAKVWSEKNPPDGIKKQASE
jgi:uncharacterized protein